MTVLSAEIRNVYSSSLVLDFKCASPHLLFMWVLGIEIQV